MAMKVRVEKGYGPRHAFNAQEGSEAVPSELPTPPAPPKTYAGHAMEWVADQVRQGVLPDEALAEIKRDPSSMRSLMAYAEAAMSAGTLLSGGEGRMPRRSYVGEFHLPDGKVVNLHQIDKGQWKLYEPKEFGTGEYVSESPILSREDFVKKGEYPLSASQKVTQWKLSELGLQKFGGGE